MRRLQQARRGTRAPRARVLRHLPRESAWWRFRVCAHANIGCSLEAVASTSEHGRAPMERAVSLAQWAFVRHGPTPTSAAPRASTASARAPLPPERERVVAHFPVHTRERPMLVEAAAGKSEHGRAPKERAVSLAQWPSKRHGPTPTDTERRARAASARAAPPHEIEHAVARSHVRTRERWLVVGGSGWHVRAWVCTEAEGRLVGVLCFHRARTGSNQCGAARARRKRACCATSRERARGGRSPVRTRERRLLVGA